MKQELHFVRLGLVMVALLVTVFVASSAPDSPSRSIASGGGTSSGGSFIISGTIGQLAHRASHMVIRSKCSG